ncbi:ARPP-2 domain-containing protein [Sorangium sp. So ce1078]|uniref:ARPP-2 domain-containing protein n=1 Tax=Sorangium sp. So ce1078 TaxID=3133329 RepID=UPI003F5FE81B
MAKAPALLQSLSLRGLSATHAQVFAGVRLVPLLRAAARDDLRIARRGYDDTTSIVGLAGGAAYCSTYVPHALVVGWTDDGSPVASYGAALAGPADGRTLCKPCGVQLLHRMARREARGEDPAERNRLRLLPQHLAMEGFLALHFNAPEIAWSEYSRRAISHGLDPRREVSLSGRAIPSLEDALRVFEIHEGQCGLLLFVGELLASVFVVSHPDDYRALHRTLIEDAYDQTLLHAARHNGDSQAFTHPFDAAQIGSLDDLRAALGRARAEAGALHVDTAAGLLGRPIAAERVYRAGPFSLQRFMTELDPALDNHIGEAIVRDDGTLEYAKTYRLSAGQVRRARLLQQLAAHGWNLDATAAALRIARDQLLRRIDGEGFGYLIAEHVLKAALKRAR